MGELAIIPKRRPIYIVVPHSACEVIECDGIRQFDMVVLHLAKSYLEIVQVCGRHAFLWKDYAPVLFFPLNTSPNIEFIKYEVEKELARRRPAPVYQQTTFYGGNYNVTGGTTYFRFG